MQEEDLNQVNIREAFQIIELLQAQINHMRSQEILKKELEDILLVASKKDQYGRRNGVQNRQERADHRISTLSKSLS